MLVLKLCQQFCPHLIPVTPILPSLGDGADGEVFDIADQSDKVIKFCLILGDQVDPATTIETYLDTKKVLEYLQIHPSNIFAQVYDHQFMGEYTRTVWGNLQEKLLLHYYIVEKLNKISEDERKVFHTILSHEDREIVKNYTRPQVKKMLDGLSRGLDFDAEKVMFFCDRLRVSPVIHLDVEVRNIMKDSVGNFKLIDFDRAILRRE